MPYAYIVHNEPQLCVWDTEPEAESERAKIKDSKTSEVFELPECALTGELYDIIEDAIKMYAEICR